MTRPLAGLLAAIVLLGGCSGGSDRSSSAPPAEEAGSVSSPASGTPSSTVPSPTEPVLDDAARAELVATAARATETLLSYDHRTLDIDLGNATSLMTPAFAARFTRTYDALRERAASTQASVRAVARHAGLVGASADQATVLVLIDQTSRTNRAPRQTTSQAPVVTLRRSGDAWLVADLRSGEPVPTTETDPARRAVLDAAAEMGRAFLNVSWTSIDADVGRVRELATSPFRDDYTSSSASLVSAIRKNRTVQVGRVLVSGLVSAEQDSTGEDTATAILAATGTVHNDGSDAEPMRRDYHLRIDLELVDGAWLVSGLELLT